MHVRTTAVLLALLLVAACAPDEPDADDPEGEDTGREAELEDDVAELEAELEALRRENEELRQELADAEAAPGPDDPQEPDLQLVGEPEPVRTEDGVSDQLRAYFPPAEPADMPEDWQPDVTEWHPAEVPDGFGAGAGYDSPGDLVTALAAEQAGPTLGGADGAWEVTVRALTPDAGEVESGEAIAGLLEWGYLDDAQAGRDLRLDLVEDDDGWYVEAVSERLHCTRGVTEIDGRPGCV